MAKHTSQPGIVNSYIGEGTVFSGDLNLQGVLRIDGDFTGNINSDGKVLIGSSGRSKCSIHARRVVIGGAFRGDIYASEKITILESGVVIGNLYAPRLEVAKGVVLEATCTISPLPGKHEDITSHGYKVQKGGYFSINWDEEEQTPQKVSYGDSNKSEYSQWRD